MGMNHFSHGHTQDDETARIFQQRVKRGEFVEVGKDRDGQPLYMDAHTVHAPLPGLRFLIVADFVIPKNGGMA